jgi:hypothetical protein
MTCGSVTARRRRGVHPIASILFAFLAGCGPRHLHVSTIQLGRSLNADSTVAEHTTSFKPDDTIFVSVLTSGMGAGTISVRWTYAGRVIAEPKKQVSYTIPAATDFRLQSPAGFPVGEYSVEVFVDGQSVGTRTFHVAVPR